MADFGQQRARAAVDKTCGETPRPVHDLLAMTLTPRSKTPTVVKRRILLVDDHPIMREGFAQLLNTQADLTVCGQAGDPASALDRIKILKPDLAIVDLSLIGTSGIELIKQVKAIHSKQVVLVLSMHDEAVYCERALRAGASGYVMKQEPIEEIMAAIRDVLEGELFLSKNMRSSMVSKFLNRSSSARGSGMEKLSDREFEVFQMIGLGRKTSQIAKELHLSVKTVETYRAKLKEKMNLVNGMELVRHAVEWVTKQQSWDNVTVRSA